MPDCKLISTSILTFIVGAVGLCTYYAMEGESGIYKVQWGVFAGNYEIGPITDDGSLPPSLTSVLEPAAHSPATQDALTAPTLRTTSRRTARRRRPLA